MKLGAAVEALVGAVRLRPGLRHEDYVAALAAGRVVRSGHGPSVRYWPLTAPVPAGVAPEAWALLEQLRDLAGDPEALEAITTAVAGRPQEAALRAWVDAGRPVDDAAPDRQRWRILRPHAVGPSASE